MLPDYTNACGWWPGSRIARAAIPVYDTLLLMNHQIGTAGFEPALTRFQSGDVDQATPRPVAGHEALTPRYPYMLYAAHIGANFL